MFLCKLRRWHYCSFRKTQWMLFFSPHSDKRVTSRAWQRMHYLGFNKQGFGAIVGVFTSCVLLSVICACLAAQQTLFTKAHQFLRIFSSNQFSSQSACHVSGQHGLSAAVWIDFFFFSWIIDYVVMAALFFFFFFVPIPLESSLKSWHRPGSSIRLARVSQRRGRLLTALMVHDKAFLAPPESSTAG